MTIVDGCQVTFIVVAAQCSRGQSCRAWKTCHFRLLLPLPLTIYLWSICRHDVWNMGGWTNYYCLSNRFSFRNATDARRCRQCKWMLNCWLGGGGLHFCEVISALLNFPPEFLEGEGAARDPRTYFRAQGKYHTAYYHSTERFWCSICMIYTIST